MSQSLGGLSEIHVDVTVYHVPMIAIEITSAHGGYRAEVGSGLLAGIGTTAAGAGLPLPRSVVTDATVGPLYGRRVARDLGARLVENDGGETNKTWATVETTLRRWLEDGLDRSSTVLALGGGIVTDTVGFAAATYLRGIAWIAAPTTLLGMVDAAVGGKTGVNLPEGKNLVGAFWPPALVVADTDTLATLPPRELRSGLAEVVKAAWISDHSLLDLVPVGADIGYDSLTKSDWVEMVARSIRIKSEIVAADEREAGLRKSLNLGHTLGHALETATGYERFLHGEAVAWGLEAAALLGLRRKLLAEESARRLRGAARSLGERPPIADLDADRVCSLIAVDKKRDAEGVAWVLPTDDGVVLDQRVETSEIVDVLRELQRG
jgi:3-dehydroquinate synthase